MQSLASHDALARRLAEYEDSIALYAASLQAQVDRLTQLWSHSSTRESELVKSKRTWRERCELLEQRVMALEKGREEDQFTITSLSADLNHSHARLQEEMDGQVWLNQELAWLKANLAWEMEWGLQLTRVSDHASSPTDVQGHCAQLLIVSPPSPNTSIWGTLRSAAGGRTVISTMPLSAPSSLEEYQAWETERCEAREELQARFAAKIAFIFQSGFNKVVQQCSS